MSKQWLPQHFTDSEVENIRMTWMRQEKQNWQREKSKRKYESIKINYDQNKKKKVCEENKLVKQKMIFDQLEEDMSFYL